MLENHWTRTAQSPRVGCSREETKYILVYLAVKKANLFVNILLLILFLADYCHIYPAVYLLNKIYVS